MTTKMVYNLRATRARKSNGEDKGFREPSKIHTLDFIFLRPIFSSSSSTQIWSMFLIIVEYFDYNIEIICFRFLS